MARGTTPSMTSTPPEAPSGPPPAFFRLSYLGVSALIAFAYVIVSWFLPVLALKIPLGLVVLFFVPGYALGAIAFGERPNVSWAALAAFTVGLSVVTNVLVGIILTAGSAGLPSSVFSVFALSLVLLAILVQYARGAGFYRPTAVSRIRAELALPGFSKGQRRIAYVLLVAIVVVFAGIVYLGQIHPNESPDVTLALLGPGGIATSLPTAGSTGELINLTVSVTNNNTAQTVTLTLTSVLNGTNLTNFTRIAWVQPMDLGPQVESSLAIPLAPVQAVSENVTLIFSAPGVYLVAFQLLTPENTERTAGLILVIV